MAVVFDYILPPIGVTTFVLNFFIPLSFQISLVVGMERRLPTIESSSSSQVVLLSHYPINEFNLLSVI